MARDIEKLPKWARNKIRRLEADLASATRMIKGMAGEESEGPRIMAQLPSGQKMPLPVFSIIRFGADRSDYIEVKLGEHINSITVRAHGRVAIEPRASNSFECWTQD